VSQSREPGSSSAKRRAAKMADDRSRTRARPIRLTSPGTCSLASAPSKHTCATLTPSSTSTPSSSSPGEQLNSASETDRKGASPTRRRPRQANNDEEVRTDQHPEHSDLFLPLAVRSGGASDAKSAGLGQARRNRDGVRRAPHEHQLMSAQEVRTALTAQGFDKGRGPVGLSPIGPPDHVSMAGSRAVPVAFDPVRDRSGRLR
jgi:hypothetical protein